MNKLKIEYIKTNEIIPYSNNQRNHSKEQINILKKSIKEFGFANPILLDKNNEIIAGHGRFEAGKKLKLKEFPCVRIENLTDNQIKALRLADNRIQDLSDFDEELVSIEIKKLLDDDFDISSIGFNIDDFSFLDSFENKTDEELEEIPEEPKEAKTKIGDLYEIDGKHRLLCGDSTCENTVGKLMNGEKADMVFTDPPYGMFLNADFSGMKSNSKLAKEKNICGGQKHRNVKGDHKDFSNDLILSIFKNFNYCDEIFLWGADYFAELLENKNKGSWVVWDKRANINGDISDDISSDKMYGSCFELCWSKNKHKRDIARVKWACVFGTEKEFDHKRHHPTQKPILLSEWFICRFSKENNLIADLFGGSGSTLIACEKNNRISYNMELDEKYCDVIISRYKKLKPNAEIKLNGKVIEWVVE